MNRWRNTKKGRIFLRLSAIILCFCVVLTGYPNIPEAIPVFAAARQGESEKDQEEESGKEQSVSYNGQITGEPAVEGSAVKEPVEEEPVKEPVISGWHFDREAVYPDGDLLFEDGIYSLILAGGNEETQILFEEIVDILPGSVTAELTYEDREGADSVKGEDSEESGILEATETEEKVLPIIGWSCPEYIRDENGKLPYSGRFFFQAVLSEGKKEYAMKEGAGRMGIWVVFDEPALMGAVTAAPGVINSDQEWGEQTLAAGTYTIAPGVTVTVSGKLTVSGTVTINGGGTLVRSGSYQGTDNTSGSNNCMLYVSGETLNLENVTIDGNNVEAYGPAIYQDSGVINLEGGAVIQNNKNMNASGGAGTYAGGGIYCGGTLNINGGSIRNCATSGVIGSSVYSHAGGAVYLKGTCNMTAGSITGNSASNGGGIYLASTGATLNLSGGTIAGNEAAGNGKGIYYSTLSSSRTSTLYIGGNANVSDIIYLDNTTGSRCPLITSELHYPVTLACSSREEGKILAQGSGGYVLTGVDASKVSMAETAFYSRLDKENNQIYLSQTEDVEAAWQEAAGGEWKRGDFDDALTNVYDGGTVKLLKDILITGQVRISKNVTIVSDDPSNPCTMTRMPSGSWGNITLSGSGAGLTLADVIYDGNRDHLSGGEEATTQSLVKVGDGSSDTGAKLVLGSGTVIRNGYKRNGSGVIAVYGSMEMADGAVIENCEVSGTGGAIWVSSAGSFTMNGGSVRGCRANGGSAVSVDGTCLLKGGNITGNTDSSNRDCAVYLRSSGSGILTVNGVKISDNENSIYNDGKQVVIAGDSEISGRIYTTNAVRAQGNGVSGLGKKYTIKMPDTLTAGTVVVTGSTDSAHYELASEDYCLKAFGGNLIAAIPSYTITYEKDGGRIVNENNYTSYTYGTGLRLPEAAKAGYDFAGWYTDRTFAGSRVTEILPSDRGDKVYYAKWVDNTPPAAPRLKTGVTLPAGWTNGQDRIPVTASDELGIARLWVKVDNGGYTEVENTRGTSITYDHPALEGSHTYVFKAEDHAGNLSDESETFTLKLDTIKPELGAISYNYEPKTLWQWLIGKESLVITVPVSDNAGGSGVEEVIFTVTPYGEASREQIVSVQGGTAQITVSADFKRSVSLECSDRAGNLSDRKTVGANGAAGIIIEDNPPEISFAIGLGRAAEEEIYDTAPDVTVTVTDDKNNAISGGIASVTYQVGDESVQTVNRDYTGSMVYHDSFVISASEIPYGETTIRVWAEDHAGNTAFDTQDIQVRVPHVHSYGTDWEWNEDEHWHECECGDRADVAGHSMGDWITDEEATEEEEGRQHRKCSQCDYTEQGTIPKKEPVDPGTVSGTVEKGENTPDMSISASSEQLKDLVLTEAEKQQVESGKDMNILLKIEDGENTVSQEEKAAIDSTLQGFKVGQYLDVTLYKEIDGIKSQMSETPGKITMTIAVPEDLKKEEGGRIFAVICVSDGRTEFLNDLDTDGNTITIETDRFAVYAIVYKDESGNEPEKPDDKGDGTDQKPGDGNSGNDAGDNDDQNTGSNTGNGDDGNSGNGNGNPNDNTGNNNNPGGGTGNNTDTGSSTGSGAANNANNAGGSAINTSNAAGAGGGNRKDNEPKTGGSSPVELYATLAMIAGLSYLLLYFAPDKKGMTEEKKKELVSKLIGWAKHRGRLCRLLALAMIFLLLVYYHAIGKKPLEEPVVL